LMLFNGNRFRHTALVELPIFVVQNNKANFP